MRKWPSVDSVAHLNDVYCQVTHLDTEKSFYTVQLQSLHLNCFLSAFISLLITNYVREYWHSH